MLPRPDRQRRSRLNNFRFAVPALMTGLAVMLSTGVVQASPEFPEQIQEVLSLDCVPVCVLCHRTADGGLNTLREPFGTYIKGMGVLQNLPGAFRAVEQDPNGDSDGDGINDVAEIRANTNPNVKDLPNKPSDPICSAAQYGCGARIAPAPAPGNRGWGLFAALGVAALLLGQRRRSALGR